MPTIEKNGSEPTVSDIVRFKTHDLEPFATEKVKMRFRELSRMITESEGPIIQLPLDDSLDNRRVFINVDFRFRDFGRACDTDQISRSIFIDCDLRDANLSEVDLSDAIFWRSDLRFANFRNANASGLILFSIQCQWSNWMNARITGAQIRHVDFQGSRADGCNFGQSNIVDSNFDSCLLTDACFDDSTIAKTKFTNAHVFQTKFDDAVVDDVCFEDVTGATIEYDYDVGQHVIVGELKDVKRKKLSEAAKRNQGIRESVARKLCRNSKWRWGNTSGTHWSLDRLRTAESVVQF